MLVTNEGVAVLRGAGAAVVRATWGNTTGAQVLVSTPASAVKLVVQPAAVGPVARGQLVQLSAVATFSDGTTRDVTAEALWGSLNGALALGNEPGQFLALFEGAAEARASFDGQSAEWAFQVEGAVLTSLEVQAPEQVLSVGDQQRLEVLARFSDGTEEQVGKHCRWSSSDEVVLQVSEDGVISAVKAGFATVVVNLDGQSASLDFQIGERAPANLIWPAQPRLLEIPVARVRGMVSGQVFVAPRADSGGVVVAEQVELSSITTTLPGGRLELGQRASFAVIAAYSDGSEQNVTAQTKFLSGPEVKVLAGPAEAFLQAEALGVVTVTAEFEGQVVQFMVEVTAEHVNTLILVPLAGDPKHPGAARVEAIARWSDGAQTIVTELAEWSSNDPKAQVSNVAGARGLVVGSGAATISCQVGAAHATVGLVFPTKP